MIRQISESSKAPQDSAVSPPILRLYLDEEVVFAVGADEVPVEKLPVVELTRAGQALRFVDSKGATRTYDRRSFRLQSFHAGFSDLTYLYCSKQPHTLVASSDLEDAPPVLGEADAASVARFESRLPSCEQCGGAFRYMNPLRCPHCLEPYIDFEKHPADRANEYYGNYLYGGALQHWEPESD